MSLRSSLALLSLVVLGAVSFVLLRGCTPTAVASSSGLVVPAVTENRTGPEGQALTSPPEAGLDGARQSVAEAGRESLRGDALLEALQRLGRANLADSAALESAIVPLLDPPSNLPLILQLLMGGGLADGSYLSLAEIGALRALVFGAWLGSDSRAELPAPIDAHGLLLLILEGLPEVLEPAREALVQLLASMTSEKGEPLVDHSFAADLERLRDAYPELAPYYERLLAALLGGSEPADGALRMNFMLDKENPTLVTAGLSRWLEENPDLALVWAAETFDDPSASPELERAISCAVAQAAPVEAAVEFLATRARREMLGEFLSLGGREGGLEALRDEYWKLRILGNADEGSRRMLVSGMLATNTEELLSIAGEDPSATVRSQAWMTLTASPDFQPSRAVLDRLLETIDRPELGLEPGEVVTALGNFSRVAARQGGDPRLLADTREALIRCYRDHGQPDWVRNRALEKLKGLISDAEIAALSPADS